MKKTKDERRNIAFNILQKYHDIINKVGENPSEYDEDRILDAMEEYATQQQSEAVELEKFTMQDFMLFYSESSNAFCFNDKLSDILTALLKEKGGEE